jgi:hypothetical protein
MLTIYGFRGLWGTHASTNILRLCMKFSNHFRYWFETVNKKINKLGLYET